MSNARNSFPLPPAFAAGAVARVGRSLLIIGEADMAHRTALLPIDRGVTR